MPKRNYEHAIEEVATIKEFQRDVFHPRLQK